MSKIIEYIQAILFMIAMFLGASDEEDFTTFVTTKIAALVILLIVVVLNFVKESFNHEKKLPR